MLPMLNLKPVTAVTEQVLGCRRGKCKKRVRVQKRLGEAQAAAAGIPSPDHEAWGQLSCRYTYVEILCRAQCLKHLKQRQIPFIKLFSGRHRPCGVSLCGARGRSPVYRLHPWKPIPASLIILPPPAPACRLSSSSTCLLCRAKEGLHTYPLQC